MIKCFFFSELIEFFKSVKYVHSFERKCFGFLGGGAYFFWTLYFAPFMNFNKKAAYLCTKAFLIVHNTNAAETKPKDQFMLALKWNRFKMVNEGDMLQVNEWEVGFYFGI